MNLFPKKRLIMILFAAFLILPLSAFAQTVLTEEQLKERLVGQIEALFQGGVQEGEHLAAGRTYLELREPFYALPELMAEYRRDPGSLSAQSASKEIADIFMMWGEELLDQGAPERALAFLNAADHWLVSYRVNILRGDAFMMMERPAEAAHFYAEAQFHLVGDDALVLKQTYARILAEDPEKAREVLSQAARPEQPEVILAKLWLAAAENLPEDLFAELENLPPVLRSSGEALLLEIWARRQSGEEKLDAERIIAGSVWEERPVYVIIRSAEMLGELAADPDAALRFLRARIEEREGADKKAAESLLRLESAQLLLENGLSSEALTVLEPLKAPYPLDYYRLRSRALEEQGQFEAAFQEQDRIKKIMAVANGS